MAQFAGKGGINWLLVIVILLLIVLAIIAYFAVTDPGLFSFLQRPDR